MTIIEIGDQVHVDTDNKEWGRVVSDGWVIELYPTELLIRVDSIQATILVPCNDANPTT